MCGICGHTGDPEGRAVRAMNTAMVYRGPDDEGVHTDPDTGVSLGARRLSVIDVAGGHQPLANEDSTVWAVLSGEIYNHPRLRRMLHNRGHRLATGTDTEVLVHLYEEYGDDLVYALEGMFAFALWDRRERRLLVARDRFGEKPLFYAIAPGGGLSFASELTTLAAGGGVGGELDPLAVDQYFVHGYVPGELSVFCGSRQLAPGHTLVWRPGTEPTIRRYWTPPTPTGADAETEADLVAEAGRLLTESVRSRLVADVPLGSFLGGGVASTLVAAIAARESNAAVKTFTVGYDIGGVGETAAARETARELGSEHHELILPVDEVGRRVPDVLGALDQPQADQSFAAFQVIAAFAREDVTVAIGSEGADELFGGDPRYRRLARAEALAGMPSLLRAGAGRLLGATLPAGRAGRLADLVQPRGVGERHLLWVAGERVAVRRTIYGPRLAPESIGALVERLELDAIDCDSVPGRFMLLDQTHRLPGDILAKADRASMQVSLEVRTPYLNNELAEFAATVAPELHVSGGGGRILRTLLTELLPKAAKRRPGPVFRMPSAEWLRGPLAPTLRGQLDGSAVAEGWLDRGALAGLVDQHQAGIADHSATLWPALAFGLWLDRIRGRDDGV